MASQPILLPWASGLDRATGGPSEDADSFADMRNIVYFPGAVRLRPGLGDAVNTLADPVVCSVSVFQAYGLLIWCLYDGTDVNVVQTNLQGQSEVAVGTFGPLNASAQTPPRFTMAEAFGILVVAHDEPNVAYRFDTYRFDPADTENEWDTIDADLDNAGSAPVQFRGVVQHLGAIWGWGYGSASDPDRPEVLRRSDPADPTVYVPEQYVQFGARLDPIIGCSPVSGSLAVLKGSSWHRLDGNTAATFSPQLVDPVIGLVSAQALQNIGGRLYWWSPYGPRATTGSGTEDISTPLDLTGPLPADLPALGPNGYCFTYYDPDNQKLGFAFPDPDGEEEATVAYCVSLMGGPLKWSIDQINRTVLCAVLASTGQSAIAVDPGSADNVTVEGAQGDALASATIGWDNVDCVGDETVEIWGRMNAGAWSLLTSLPVNTGTTPQTTVVTGGILTSGTLDVSIRHRRLGRYLPAYQDASNPGAWPADSQGTGTIVALPPPTGLAITYSYTDGDVDATWTNGDPLVETQIELSRVSGTPTMSATKAAGVTTHTFTYAVGTPQQVARSAAFTATGDAQIRARIRHVSGGITGGWSAYSNILSITYDGAMDGAGCVRDDTQDRVSVALGSGTALDITRPSPQASDLTVLVVVNGNTYGAIPANSGCGMTVGPIGTPGYPVSASYTLYSDTIPNTDPATVNTGFLPIGACATCLVVGQNVGMGSATVILGWQKAGDFAPHAGRVFVNLPGFVGGMFTCTI